MRKLVYGLGGLLLLLVVAAVVVVLTVDLNGYKPEIEAELERATGREVMIGGDIHMTFTPSLAVAVDDLRIAGAPGASGDPLLALPRLEGVVALLPLLSGDVRIERIRLVAPVVVLERGTDGTASWAVGGADSQGGGAPGVSIGRLEIENGTVIWRDEAGEERFESLEIAAAAPSLEGPFEAVGTFVNRGRDWDLSADIGRISRPQIPLNVVLASDAGRFALAGSADATGPAFSGQLQAEGPALGTTAALAGAVLPAGLAALPFSLDTGLSASVEGGRLADTVIALGDTRIVGGGELDLTGRPSGQLVLSAPRVDLDALLAGPAGAGPQADVPGEAAGFDLPQGFDLGLDLAVDVLGWRGQAVRQLRLVAGLDEGVVTVSQAAAQLPGGAGVALAGTLAAEDGEPVFRGPLEVNADNLRATLAWLGEDLPEVPADRLRRVDLAADAVLRPGAVRLQALDLSVDSSRLTGTVAAEAGEVPAIAAEITLDRINLDAYLPPHTEGGETDDAASQPFVMPPLPALDVVLDARIEQLTYNGVAVSGVVAEGSLRDGRLDIASLGAADIAGAALRTSGTVDPAAGRIDLKLGAQADNAAGLLRLLGLDVPIDPARLGHVELTGEVSGGTDRAVVRQRLDTGLGQASIDGTVLDVLGRPGFDGRLGLKASSYRTLAEALDVDLPEAADSAIALAADVTTDGESLESNAVLELLGATIRAGGSASGLQDTLAFDLRAVAEHPEMGDLLSDLGAAGGGEVGPLRLDVAANGDEGRVDVTLAPSTIGDSTLRGTLALDLARATPYGELRLQAGALALDPLLAAASGGTLGDADAAGAAGAERWSAEPIDLAVLRSVDGRLELTAETATLQGMTLTSPVVVAGLADGALVIERFDGGLFDGRIALTGRIAEGSPHAMSFDLALGDADAQALLQRFADSDRIAGRLFLDATLAANGASQRDLVGSLAGEGAISLRDGVVQGFDLGAISDRLGNLDNEAAIVALMAEAGTGGETAVQAADGTFVVEQGIARSDDLAVVLEGGKADVTMVADLPRWWIDLDGVAMLTAHPNAPTIPITVEGPIDAPTRTVDTSALQAFLVQRVAETALRKLGGDSEAAGAAGQVLDLLTGGQQGGGSGQQPEAAPEPAPDAAPQPEQAAPAGNLLDLLTGGQQQGQPAPPEQGGGQPLDGDALLNDLLKSLGN